jgi:hypothetical protein
MITPHDFLAALHCVLVFANRYDSPRDDLQGVLFDFIHPTALNLVGTNGQRIAVVKLSAAHGFPAGSFFMSCDWCSHLIMWLVENEPIRFFPMGDQLMVMQGDRVLTVPAAPHEPFRYASIFFTPGAATQPGKTFHTPYITDALEALQDLAGDQIFIDIHNQPHMVMKPTVRPEYPAVAEVQVAIAASSMYYGAGDAIGAWMPFDMLAQGGEP